MQQYSAVLWYTPVQQTLYPSFEIEHIDMDHRMNEKNIVLTGFMGTGKSTVGKELARRINYTFIDTDHEIADREQCSIADIFTLKGEACFRKLESDIARELSGRHRLVIATGGKLMLNAENARVLQQTGEAFCLTASVEEIVRRVKDDQGAVRPLLSGDAPEEKIRSLLAEREKGYSAFHQVDTDERTVAEIVEQILQTSSLRG